MTEISRDGKRVYFTNSLYSTLGRAVLSRRRAGRAGDVPRRRRRRHHARSEVLRRVRRATTARTRSVSRAATARPIRSATRRPEPGASMSGRRIAALWLAVVALGVYHGLNPGDGLAARGRERHVERQRDARRVRRRWRRWRPGTFWRWRSSLLPFALLSWYVALEHASSHRRRRGSCCCSALYKLDRPAPSALCWRESRPTQLGVVVVPDGDGARRGADAGAGFPRPLRGRLVGGDVRVDRFGTRTSPSPCRDRGAHAWR